MCRHFCSNRYVWVIQKLQHYTIHTFSNGWELPRAHDNNYMERVSNALYKYFMLSYNETFLYSLVHCCTLEAYKESVNY